MSALNDKTKKVTWKNRNYLFLGTILIIVLNIVLFAVLGNDWVGKFEDNITAGGLNSQINFNNLIIAFLNSFSHANWQHVLLNMLCLFICGLYLERKMGSFKFFFFTFILAFFTSIAITANSMLFTWHGFSGVNYALFFYIIVDYIFSFRKERRSKGNIIFGAIILILIYLAMSFINVAGEFAITWYPIHLVSNIAHYTSALVGLLLGIVLQFAMMRKPKENEWN